MFQRDDQGGEVKREVLAVFPLDWLDGHFGGEVVLVEETL